MSEETEVQAQAQVSGKKKGMMSRVLEIGTRAGIILAAIAFVSEYEYRHIERTVDAFQQTIQKPPQSDVAAMALSYLNQEITYPFCPLKSICSVRGRHSFENLELYNQARDKGVRLEKANLRSQSLAKASFITSDMRKVSISEIDLNRASFKETLLQEAQLLDVDLKCAKFLNSDLSGATIYYKNIAGAEFLGTNVSNLQMIDPEGGPQAIDPDEDKGQEFKTLKKFGLTPATFAGAWAWRGEEPVVPKAYQTYSVCDKPVGGVSIALSKPANCQVKRQVQIIPQNVCQQLEASPTMYKATINWLDRQILALKGTQ